MHAAHGLNVAGGGRFERELAAQRYFQPFAAEMEFVVQIKDQIQIERHGFGGFGFGFAQNDHVVVQRGRIAFLKTEAAFVGDQFTVQSEAVVAVQHFGGAGHGELAVHLVEHRIAFKHHLRIDIRRAVGERGAAGERYRTVFARELQAVHQPAVAVQMRFERAVVEDDADLAVAVAQIVAGQCAAELRLVHLAADGDVRVQASGDRLADGHHVAQRIQVFVGQLQAA